MPLSDEKSRWYNRMSKLDTFLEHKAIADLYAPMKKIKCEVCIEEVVKRNEN